MASITFRGLLGRIEELERQKRAKTYWPGHWNLTPEQRKNLDVIFWYIRKPDCARRLFGHLLLNTAEEARLWSGHYRIPGPDEYDARDRYGPKENNFDRCALDAFDRSPALTSWLADVLFWEDHDGRYLSLLEQREVIWSWYERFVTAAMCPDWLGRQRRGWAHPTLLGAFGNCQTRLDRLPGEPIPCEVPATMSLPTAEAVHQKRLELWEKCQRYGTEPTMEETAEWYTRRFGGGCADGV